MKRKASTLGQVVDYSAARARAIRWLGERYLLARPINASRHGSGRVLPGVVRTPVDDAPDPQPLISQ